MRRARVLVAQPYAAPSPGGVLHGTRSALVVVPAEGEPRSIDWQQVHEAGWDAEESTLTVAEVGEYAAPRPVHRFVLDEPGRLLELVRERVSASLVLQRRVEVAAGAGLTVIARRPPAGSGATGAVSWYVDHDPGLDPADPVVRDLAVRALAQARAEIG